jgi:hypothetical protein
MNLKLLICIVISISLLSAFKVTLATTDGLIAYYPFEGNVEDASGLGHHGRGQVTFVAGKVGQAARFQGKKTVIQASLPEVKKTYSVSLFAQFKRHRQENQLFYLTRPKYKDRLGYLSTWPAGKKTWHFGSRRYGKGWEDRKATVVDPQGLLLNQWFHVVFILNDKDISLFVNGKRLKTIHSAHHADIEAHKDFLFLIGGSTENYQGMDGLIDEVRVFNRVLSGDEIQSLSEGQMTTRSASPFSCEQKRACKKMTSCDEAYYHLQRCGRKSLDRDKDGIPCEAICVEKADRGEVSEEKGFDLSGIWVGEGYECDGQVSQQRVKIEQKGYAIVGTQMTGDACVPAGSRTFSGTLDTLNVTWTTGYGNWPACCEMTGQLTLLDNNEMGVNGFQLKFTRTSSQGDIGDLRGTWLGEGYQCGWEVFQEEVKIEQQGNAIVATKLTGDPCVPAGSRSFSGVLDTAHIIWTRGYPTRPACCQEKGILTVVDEKTLRGGEITFKRIGP